LFLTVCTPSGVNVDSMMYVGMPVFYPIGTMVWNVPAMSHRLLVLAVALSALPATAAGAAEVITDRGCYADPSTRKDTVTWTGSGFTPGGLFQAALDGAPLAGVTGNADPAGLVGGSFPAPALNAAVGAGTLEHVFNLAILEGANAPAVPFTVSKLRASFRPTSGNPRTLKVRFALYGFGLAGARAPRLYMHYVRPNDRLRSTVKLGTGKGACGSLTTARRRLFGFRVASGTWTLQFDTVKKYRRGGTQGGPAPFYRIPVRVG
jgi:hypothetical protein